MGQRLCIVLSLLGLVAVTAPAHAATSKPAARPTQIAYHFTKGRVLPNRNMQLTLDIHTRDPFDHYNNGDYAVGATAQLAQFVVSPSTRDGSNDVQVAFSDPTTKINGNVVRNALPDVNVQTGVPISYVMHITPSGVCQPCLIGISTAANQAPGPDASLIYDVTGPTDQPIVKRTYLGDLFTYLHPSLPRKAAQLAHTWYTTLPIALCGSVQPVSLVSNLVYQNKAWVVISRVNWIHTLTFKASQCQPYVTLPTDGAVTISATFSIDSTLTIQPGPGYPMPLDGTERLKLVYTQSGTQIFSTDLKAHLTVSGIQATAPGH